MAIATLYTELDLDMTKFQAKQKKLLDDIKKVGTDSDTALQRGFMNLGVTSDKVYDLMAEKARVSYERINQSANASIAERTRAHAAYSQKIQAIDNQRNAVQIAKEAEWLAVAQKASEAAVVLREKENLANQQFWMAKMAYDKKAAAESVAAQATAQQQIRSMGLLQIAAIKEDADRTLAIKNKAKEAELANYATLGMKSTASINEQIANVKRAATAQQAIVGKSSEDWIRIERAKNAKLIELNKEMTGAHEMSMASMTRAVLRVYAAYYVLSNAIKFLLQPLQKGFMAVEELTTSIASMAAMVVSFSERAKGVSMAEQWKQALEYSQQLIPVLEKVAARTLLSSQETTALANAFARSGVFLQANNKEQMEGFVRLSNALPLMTKGQEIMRQINTEIRALMTGTNTPGSMLIKTLEAIDPLIEKNLKIWREQNTIMENIGKLLEGFGPATEILEMQWQAVKTTLDTTVTQILRAGMLGAYGELILSAKDLDKYLNENKDSLINGMSRWVGNFLLTMYTIKAEILRLAMLLDKIGGTMTQMKALLYVPGTFFGAESSTERFNTAIKQNKELENRYKANEKELEALAERYIKLEASISAAGLAKAKLEREGTGNSSIFKAKPGVDEDAKAAEKAAAILRNKLAEATALNKEYYDEAVAKSNHWLRMQQINGESDLEATKQVIEDKKVALNIWYDAQENAINKYVVGETKKKAELAKLWRDYSKQWTQLKYEEIETNAKLIQVDIKNEQKRQEGYEEGFKRYSELKSKEHSEQQKNSEAYKKMVADEYDFASTENERQINKIIHDETKKLKDLQDLYDQSQLLVDYGTDFMSFEQYEALKAQIIENGAKARAEIQDKILQDAINFYSDLVGYEDTYYNKMLDYIEKVRKQNALLYGEEAANAKAKQSIGNLDQKLFTDKSRQVSDALGQMSSAFTAIGSMYDKNSSEYARMQEAAKAMIVLQQAVAVANAVAAIANQGLGDPYTAFARIAAMVAAMGALFASTGMSFGGGASASYTPAYGQNTTVLGGANDQGSESITKSWELMKDTYDMEFTKLTNIYNQLKDLNSNITGLVTNIVKYGTDTANWSVPADTVGSNTATWERASKIGVDAFDTIMNPGGNDIVGLLTGSTVYTTITGLLNKAISYISNGIFGGNTKSELGASGIAIDATTAKDLIDGFQIVAKQYAMIVTTTSGGWFKSDTLSTSYQYAELNSSVTEMLTKVFKNISQTLVSIAGGLGMDTQAALDYAFADVKIDFRGMTADEINTTITTYFSNLADTAVESLFGSVLKTYQALDEGLYETAVRVIQDKEIILDYLGLVNNAYSATALEAIQMSEALINLAGDLDTLTGYIDTYYDKFFSDAEKQADLYDSLTSIFTSMNSILPETRQGYRDIIEGLDLTTESGQSAYVTLMALAGYADEYYTAIEDAAENTQNLQIDLLEAQGKSVEALAAKRELELSSLSETDAAIQTQIYHWTDLATAMGITNTVMDVINSHTLTDSQLAFKTAKEWRDEQLAAWEAVKDSMSESDYTTGIANIYEAFGYMISDIEDDIKNTIDNLNSDLDLELIQATGDAAKVLIYQRQEEIDSIKNTTGATQEEIDSLVEKKQAIYDAIDAQKELNLQISSWRAEVAYLEATGNDEEAAILEKQALAAERELTLLGLDTQNQKDLQKTIWSFEDAIEVVLDRVEAIKTHQDLMADFFETWKNTGSDISKLEGTGYTPDFIETWLKEYTLKQGTEGLSGNLNAANVTSDYWLKYMTNLMEYESAVTDEVDILSMQIDLLTALGKTEESLAMQRMKELRAMDVSLRTIQLQIWAAEDLTDAIEKFKDRAKEISTFISDMGRSDLTPVGSAEAWDAEYTKRRSAAMGTEATDQQISDYLSYVNEYLTFQKTYGTEGSYQAIYDAVMDDVNSLSDSTNSALSVAEQQLDALKLQTESIVSIGESEILLLQSLIAAVLAGQALPEIASATVASDNSVSTAAVIATGTTTTGTSSSTTTTAAMANRGLGGSIVAAGEKERLAAQRLEDAHKVPASDRDALYDYTRMMTMFDSLGTLQGQDLINYNGWIASFLRKNPSWYYSAAYKAYSLGIPMEDLTFYAGGGLTKGTSIAGEKGREWIVPTYEPQRSNFLKDVGVDAEVLGKTIAKYILSANGGSNGGDIQVSVQIDGKEIGAAVARQVPRNSDLRESIKKVVNQ
jgi:hypothetical protein